MKRFILTFVALAVTFGNPAIAQDETPVPVLKAPYHVPVFKNEYVTLLNVYIPPGRSTGYHIHTTQSVSVTVEPADLSDQIPGQAQPGPARHAASGGASYSDNRKQTRTHNAFNVGTTPYHLIMFLLNSDKPGGFTPSSRADVPAYVQIMDNERVRGWRLVLEPGQSAAAVTPQAPGLRVFLSEGDLAESVPGQPDRGMHPKLGEFYWQDPGLTRALHNIGTTRVEFLEFELK